MGLGKIVGTIALVGIGAFGGYAYENHNHKMEMVQTAAVEAKRPYGLVEKNGAVYVEDRITGKDVKAQSLFKSYAMLSDIVYNFQQMQSELDIPQKQDVLEKLLEKKE
ncbi:MAG: hypothetical protein ABIJ21_01525 [Nanoarchaeota archaeon]